MIMKIIKFFFDLFKNLFLGIPVIFVKTCLDITSTTKLTVTAIRLIPSITISVIFPEKLLKRLFILSMILPSID